MCVCIVYYAHSKEQGAKMLLDLNAIKAATELTEGQIEMALARSGYNDKLSIKTTRYLGMTCNGSFVHNIMYWDTYLNESVNCNVYVSYKADPVTNYITLFGEY